MFYKKLNNSDLWKKIQTLRGLIKEQKNFKKRVCWKCKKDLNVFDFLSDNLEYTAGYILNLWQNELFEFHCCSCFKYLKREELMMIERELKSRTCFHCDKTLDIFAFSKEYDALKIKEIEETWLNPEFTLFCSRLCEKQYYKKRINKS